MDNWLTVPLKLTLMAGTRAVSLVGRVKITSQITVDFSDAYTSKLAYFHFKESYSRAHLHTVIARNFKLKLLLTSRRKIQIAVFQRDIDFLQRKRMVSYLVGPESPPDAEHI